MVSSNYFSYLIPSLLTPSPLSSPYIAQAPPSITPSPTVQAPHHPSLHRPPYKPPTVHLSTVHRPSPPSPITPSSTVQAPHRTSLHRPPSKPPIAHHSIVHRTSPPPYITPYKPPTVHHSIVHRTSPHHPSLHRPPSIHPHNYLSSSRSYNKPLFWKSIMIVFSTLRVAISAALFAPKYFQASLAIALSRSVLNRCQVDTL
jgi:hypothetical protein